MSGSAGQVIGRMLAVAFGLLWGFFVAFNVVFSDVFGVRDMLGAVAFVFVAYVALGSAFGLAGPATGWRWSFWLAPAGVLFVSLGLIDEMTRALYHAGVIAAVCAGSAGGAWIGAQLRFAAASRKREI